MVYESRPGDVISLGATSWRITEITHDRVLVIPAPGQPARLPFWRGDGVGRPAELGAAIGRSPASWPAWTATAFETALRTDGFRRLRHRQPVAAARRPAHRHRSVPTDTTLLVERFRDELGDWRVILHSPYGLRVHGPLALAVSRRLLERYGIDEKPTASDDGIVVRLPDTEDTPPGAELFVFDADEIEPMVTAEVGGSALFAVPVPGVRGPGAAAAAAASRQALAAVASAAARRPAARRRTQVPGLPDRAGDGPGVPAGRLRRARR